MPQMIWDLIEREVRKQLQAMLYCHRDGCGHIMFEHTPPMQDVSELWSYCGHPGCDCVRFDNA